MPGMNGTGPLGLGPGTGRGLGPCGAGLRRRRGRGRGLVGMPMGMAFGGRPWGQPHWGRGPWWFGPYGPGEGAAYGPSQDETAVLKEQAAYLKGELEAVQKRLAELESSQP
jgi:hypothetical protein